MGNNNKITKKCKVLSGKFGLYVKHEGVIYKLHKPLQDKFNVGDEAEFNLVTNTYNGNDQRTAFEYDKDFKGNFTHHSYTPEYKEQLDRIEKMVTEIHGKIKGGKNENERD